MRVRNVRCPGCGARKVTPSRTAYIYCDYCGRFMDWDLNAAKYHGKVAAGPHYRALTEELAPQLDAARAAHDAAALTRCHRALLVQYMEDCPNSYSPRVGDPIYREAMLARSVHATVACELDPRWSAAQALVTDAVTALEWKHGGAGNPRAVPATFWRMYDALVARNAVARKILPDESYPHPDPDDTPPELTAKMTASTIAQGWLTYLDDRTGDEFLARTGLRDEYDEVPEPRFADRACDHCGATRAVPEGAMRSLCEACGHAAAVGTAAFCGGCGAPIVFPFGCETTSCAHCKAEARLLVHGR